MLAYAHHGSVAPAQRAEIEDRLKTGDVKALVATSSLELGIDMGAIDLVVQIEAPPSVASGLQRIGRAGHQVGAPSRGVVFPKYRGDLLACAAVARAMRDGEVEPVRYPRNPLDVLAQQMVAMVAMDATTADELYAAVRRAAPFAPLSRAVFDGLLDMLAGNQVSDDFAELRPRLNWDRATGKLEAREGARRIAVISGGTIPDRGLFGVFLAGGGSGGRGAARVGELDEEMVFESRVGETFLLGASTWRIEEITHDRVLVSPAPGEPGKMPFWRGESAGRTVELGRMVGALTRELRGLPRSAARATLVNRHGLDDRAADNLLAYLRDQAEATEVVPDDRQLVIERIRDELGDWRVCVLSAAGRAGARPLGHGGDRQDPGRAGPGRRDACGPTTASWSASPRATSRPTPRWCCPSPTSWRRWCCGSWAARALFAGQVPGGGGPGAAAAPAVSRPARAAVADAQEGRRPAGRGRAPAVVPHPARGLPGVPARRVRSAGAGRGAARRSAGARSRSRRSPRRSPSPFAAGLLFGYVANYIYDGDAPLAERRAQALTVDEGLLRELLGEAELRELLDPDCVTAVEEELQQLPERLRARSADGVHDLLLRLGDLERAEIAPPQPDPGGGATASTIWCCPAGGRADASAGRRRFVAAEHASRYRDALGAVLPPGLPEAFRRPLGRSAGRAAAALRPHPRPLRRRRARRSGWACARRGASRSCTGWPPRTSWSRGPSARARPSASGATRRSCAPSAGARWPACARRSSRSSRRCWPASSPAGRG